MGQFEVRILVTQSIDAETVDEAEKLAFENIGREFDTQHVRTVEQRVGAEASPGPIEQALDHTQSPRAVDLT